MKKEDDPLSLNIGCGNQVIGDVRLDFLPTAAANIVADAGKLPFRDESFESVYERNILEHMPNPGEHLSEVARVLRTGGRLTLITDNAACVKYYLLSTHTGGYSKHGGKDKHFALFTQEHVKNLIGRAGLTLCKIELIETDYFTRPFDRIVRVFLPELSYPRIRVEADK